MSLGVWYSNLAWLGELVSRAKLWLCFCSARSGNTSQGRLCSDIAAGSQVLARQCTVKVTALDFRSPAMHGSIWSRVLCHSPSKWMLQAELKCRNGWSCACEGWILCLYPSNRWGQRHYVFGLSVCLLGMRQSQLKSASIRFGFYVSNPSDSDADLLRACWVE